MAHLSNDAVYNLELLLLITGLLLSRHEFTI